MPQEYNIQDILKSIAELREAQAQTDRFLSDKFAKTETLVKHLSQNIDGVNKSLGKDAEELFFSSLSASPRLGDITFDIVQQNALRRIGSEEMEIDILLENGNSIGIVEVKNKATLESLKELERDIARFPTFYPHMKGFKLYGALAGKTMSKSVEEATLKKGFFVLKQQGNHITITPPYAS